VFTTEESADYGALWLINSAVGALEPFSGDKLFLSIYNSIQHRPGAITDARALTDTVIQKLVAHGDGSTVSARTIAGIIQVVLNRFDTAASVHYAAFHK
jgi:transcriptional regulator NrdR family protein